MYVCMYAIQRQGCLEFKINYIRGQGFPEILYWKSPENFTSYCNVKICASNAEGGNISSWERFRSIPTISPLRKYNDSVRTGAEVQSPSQKSFQGEGFLTVRTPVRGGKFVTSMNFNNITKQMVNRITGGGHECDYLLCI